jgi:hypothetical protein
MIEGITQSKMNRIFTEAMEAVGTSMTNFSEGDNTRLAMIAEAILHRGIAMKMIELMDIKDCAMPLNTVEDLKCPATLKVDILKYCRDRLDFIYDTTIKYTLKDHNDLSKNKMYSRNIKKGVGKNKLNSKK